MINPKMNKGDRIVLLSMTDETDMGYGDRGIITDVSKVFNYLQYNVKWDKGRVLQVLEDTDKWMKEDDFDELMRKKKKIKESYTISKKKILKLILEQQEISVKDISGKITKYKNNSPEYSKFYYSPEFKAYYVWKDGIYQVDTEKWGNYNYKNWGNLSQSQKEQLIKTKSVGSYKENPNLITLGAAELAKIKNFNPLGSMDFNTLVDWIVWILKLLGPQGKILATLAEVGRGLGYMYQAYKTTDLYSQVTNFFEGVAQFFGIANVNIKIQGVNNLITKIVKYFENFNISDIQTKYGNLVDKSFIGLPKWKQSLITILVRVAGDAITNTFDWIINNLLNPLYNMLKDYNQTMANYLSSFIQMIKTFVGYTKTAKLIGGEIK